MDKIGSYDSDEGRSPAMASPSVDEKLPEVARSESSSTKAVSPLHSESGSESSADEKKDKVTTAKGHKEGSDAESSEEEGSEFSAGSSDEDEKKEKKLSKPEPTSSRAPSKRSRSRSRSRDRRHRRRRRSGERKRHEHRRRRRSRSRHGRSKRSHSRERRRKRRSRSRSRSRSHRSRHDSQGRKRRSSHRRRPRSRSPPRNFKEVMKQQLLHANNGGGPSSADSRPVSVTMPTSGSANMVTMCASGEKVTPQQALLQTMAAVHQRAQETTGVSIPKFYNPAAVNPMKYAEQVQKRKLLWGKDKKAAVADEKCTTQWKATTFTGDQTGEQAAKFRRLMGMKAAESARSAGEELSEEQSRKQDELFQQLNHQYEFARMTTHTHRGIGLGFASQGMPGPNTQQR